MSSDMLTTYLEEISRYPLLSREEEMALAPRIRAGDEAALEALVCANLRFVVSIAKRYHHEGVSLLDLIDEGNLGLLRAAERYDETKGIKFISYAVWWIRQAISQALSEQSRLVRVPLNRTGALSRLGRRANALRLELGRDATVGELAADLELTPEEISATLAIGQAGHLSLDAPRWEGDEETMLDYLADTLSAAPDEEVLQHAQSDAIGRALATLKEREAHVLRLYFGLDCEPATLEEIGSILGITRERVRQIKDKALLRLRQGKVSRRYQTGRGRKPVPLQSLMEGSRHRK